MRKWSPVQRQRPSDEPERSTSLAETATGRGNTRVLLACTRTYETDTGTCIADRCICLACTRAYETDTGACIADRCICLACTRMFRSRAIAVVVDGRTFLARTDPRTSRNRTVPTRLRLSPARTRVCLACTRISQARTRACRRERALFLRKAIGPVRNSASDSAYPCERRRSGHPPRTRAWVLSRRPLSERRNQSWQRVKEAKARRSISRGS